MTDGRPGERALLALMETEARGPRRNALFAAWLCLRVCVDATGPIGISERNNRRRLAALRKRLSTLTLPPPFRRTMQDIIEQLTESGAAAVDDGLANLRDGLRSALGSDAAVAVDHALQTLHGHAPTDVTDR